MSLQTDSLIDVFSRVTGLLRSGKAVACYTPGMGGIAEAVMKMGFGNMTADGQQVDIRIGD